MRPIIRGDQVSLSIAAASIIAKVFRDRFMENINWTHPGYTFDRHKGYGTPQHFQRLQAIGPSLIHRATANRHCSVST